MIDRYVRGRLYYGWIVVAVMSVAGAATMALGTINFGLFIKPMGDELGISRATFGWAQSLRQLAAASTSPLVGRWLDRHGARWLLAGAAAATGASVALLSQIDGGGQMVGVFLLIGLSGYAWPGTLMTSVPVMKWFVARRGRAVAMMSLGIPAGAMIFLPLTQYWIDTLGWRMAWAALGALAAIVVVPLSLLFLRRQPEDLGLEVDGSLPAGVRAPLRPEHNWTLAEARRTPVFWLLTLVFSALALAVSMIALHRIPAFMDRGLDRSLVALATAFDAVMAGAATFVMGWLSGSIRSQWIGAAGFLLLAASCVATIHAREPVGLFLAMGLFGFGIGGMMFLQNVIWAEFFGRLHLGSIRGFTMPISMLVGAVGAPLAGTVKDVGGSYEPVWWVSCGVMVFGAITVLFAKPPVATSPDRAGVA